MPNLGKITHGRDFNFFQKLDVSTASFDTLSNCHITFSTTCLTFMNEGSGSTNAVEYSFNGNTVHGDMIPGKESASLKFEGRVASKIWFRVKSGSTGPITIRIEAW